MFDIVTPLRTQLADGGYVVDGPVDVDGRSMLRLTPVLDTAAITGAMDPDAAAEAAHLAAGGTVYVDPASSLPVRIDQTNVQVEGGTITTLPPFPEETRTIEFLPRTADTLALRVPPVPAGYTRVDQLALDEVRAAGCLD